MNSPMSAKSAISSTFSLISARVRPSRAPLKKMFSVPVSSPSKPVPSSIKGAIDPRITAQPDVGVMIPAATRRSVDLPAPFEPITPNVSPAGTSNETSLRAMNQWSTSSLLPPRTSHSLKVGMRRCTSGWRTLTPWNSIEFSRGVFFSPALNAHLPSGPSLNDLSSQRCA